MSKQVLGRGLGALLGGNPAAAKASAQIQAAAIPPGKPSATVPPPATVAEKASAIDVPREGVMTMAVDRLKAGALQPRKRFDDAALDELAASIKEQGIIQPIVVREKDGYYEIIAGERRLRAAQKAGLTQVPILIRQADDATMLELMLVENLQRENLNPIEEAQGYDELIRHFNLTQETAAAKVGKSRTVVANALRLLKLPPEVQAWIREGRLSTGHAKVILSLNTAEEQYLGAEKILKDSLSVRQAEEMVSLWQKATVLPAPSGKVSTMAFVRDTHVVDVESRLQHRLGTKVSLRYRKGKGSMEIKFFSDDELERILDIVGIKMD